MTTNVAEVYNWVIRGLKGMPLVAILEGILHGIVGYYQKRHATAVLHSTTVQTSYCLKMMEYMNEKSKKAQDHMVRAFGVHEYRFEVTSKPKGGLGTDCRVVTHEVNLGQGMTGWCECDCNKPKLLHVPCSHVIAACGQLGMPTSPYVSQFYLKDNVVQTWTGEFRGFRAHDDFTVIDRDLRVCLPNMDLLRSLGKGGRPQTRRIRNNMDEAEVGGPIRRCTNCEEYGHKAAHCPQTAAGPSTSHTSAGQVVHGNLGDQDRYME